jgi:hypothetical protein
VEAPQSIEATGTTIDDAIGRGLEALNVTRSEVDILILTAEPGRTARVRLTRKPSAAAPAATPVEVKPVTPEEAATSQRLLQAVLERMKYKVQIVERDPADLNGYDEQDEPTLVLDIRGSDPSALIGRRGETLDGLQYLVRLLVAKSWATTCTSCWTWKVTSGAPRADVETVGAAHGRTWRRRTSRLRWNPCRPTSGALSIWRCAIIPRCAQKAWAWGTIAKSQSSRKPISVRAHPIGNIYQ